MVHGLPGSGRDFRYLSPYLPKLRRLRIDMPGFGETPRRGQRTWSVEQRAAFLLHVLDALEIERVHVLGHSFGGVLVTALAAAAPQRIQSVSLLASPGPRPHQGYTRSRVRLVARVLSIPGATRILKTQLRKGFIAAGFPRSTPYAQLISTVFDAAAIDFDVHGARLAQLTVPTLVAYAEDDKLVETAIGVANEGRVPDSRGLRLLTGGHNLQKTRAQELGDAIRELVHASDQGASV